VIPVTRTIAPKPKKSFVGKEIPVGGISGTPVGVNAVPVSVTATVGVLVAVGGGVTVAAGVFIVGAKVTFCPEGVAVNEGRSLSPAANTTKERLIVLSRPFLSV